MTDDRTVVFKLNGKRPDDFTIDRLAKYLSVLGELVGSPGKIRVKKLTPGSVKFELAVEQSHYPKFVERLASARNPATGSTAVRKSVEQLESMVTDDHVTADMLAGRAKLISIRGYSRASGHSVGPIVQPYKVRGTINRLEGKDATKHVGIAEYGTEREIRGEFREPELGAQLQKHLWGGVVELSGTARMMRHPTGEWELKAFRIDSVIELGGESASEIVSQLRGVLSETTKGGNDLVAAIKRLRG